MMLGKVWDISAGIESVISIAVRVQKKVGRKCPWTVLELIKNILIPQVVHEIENEYILIKVTIFFTLILPRLKLVTF